MKYYDEDESAEIRSLFEKEVLSWSRISKRSMFGCPSYLADGKLFAFLVTNGIVITQIRQRDREEVSETFETEPFTVGEREITRWLKITFEQPERIKRLMRLVKKSYRFALGEEEA